jgi:carbonyl reductase 1
MGTARLLERLGDHEVNVLVSNAVIALDGFDDDVVARTLATNYSGATEVVDALTPGFVRGSRVVMVSSGVGELSGLAPSIRVRLDPPRSRAAVRAAVKAHRA